MALILPLMLLASIVVTAVGLLGFLGKLPRNAFAGIRTPYTWKSDENWYAVHREGGPFIILGGVAAISCGLAFTPFAIAGKISSGPSAAIAIAMSVVLGLSVLVGWLYGTSKAKGRAG